MDGILNYDNLKTMRETKRRGINVADMLNTLENEGAVECTETRYDFKNTKISTGLFGVNRIFLPTCKIYPTLVASDTNDYVTTELFSAENIGDFRRMFMDKVYKTGSYRQISKSEACRIQGFPSDFILPPSRARWMKLIGNSVAVPVVSMIAKAVVNTGVFDGQDVVSIPNNIRPRQMELWGERDNYAKEYRT